MKISGGASIVTLVSALALAGPVPARDVVQLKGAVAAEVATDWPHLFDLYKDIHSHPELGFQEHRTAARLAAEMRALGFTVTEGVGKTGVVAIFENGPGPMVMVRTELDALPMKELTGLPYASEARQMYRGGETWVAHSCGHDSHMAIWVGTAKALLSLRSKWSGTLMFIGQPAEEQVGGAKGMIDDGLFTRFGGKPTYAFALHVGPAAAGELFWKVGVISSTDDDLDITFEGRGGHGSRPDITIDPVLEAARFVVDVQSVISREKDPTAFGVVTVGGIKAGSAGNIIPASAVLTGTIRTYDDTVRLKILEGVRRTAAGVAEMAGAPAPKVELTLGDYAVVNDETLTLKTGRLLDEAFPGHSRQEFKPGTASEDFSEFVRAGVPATYFDLGALDPETIAGDVAKGVPVPANHSPYFAPQPEPTIKTGVEAMTLVVMNVMPPS
jgi:hippurate hydrolase